MCEHKIAGVIDWPMLLTKKEMQLFVSFVNFYCHFIPGFSHHVHILFDLTIRFNWGFPQGDSFMKLKELITFTSAPVIVLLDNDLPF
jgi:hypothetical protein